MQRRNFIKAGAAGAMAVAGSQLGAVSRPQSAAGSEIIEWRIYEMNFGGNEGLLRDYLTNALYPALLRKGATQFALFHEYGNPNPAKLHVMISFPDAATFVAGQSLTDDEVYQKAAQEYDAVTSDKPIYTRFTSWLLEAFAGMPQSIGTDPNAGLFELRVYEGYSEDAVRRKIRMFNDHELEIFKDTDLDAVFYGNLIAGPHRPALAYLLQFDDMEERDANWAKFGAHPEWNRIKVLPEFANSVSNIQRTFLVPA
ncbi:NIPSNAP family protein [Neolewinella litorea]|uniref:NIPSNAP family containing protein n=1 Tax=Neolewinella litorea TaxID=2562452 RepID=A0A4S4NLG4_9BACT|nr:NIPSNAP family protein [Neolewinella litorea]THH39795.1 NIPSNAP family containing protein [Neolewinella litorea]